MSDAQRIAQRLAPLRERRRHRARERRRHRERGLAPHGEARHGRPDARRGREGARADVEQMPRLEPGRQHHREAAVVAAAGRGDDAVDDFLLQHHVQIVDVLVRRSDVKQQRRGDVVRQVADDAQAAAAHACQRREIELQRVGLVQLERLRRAPARAQLRGEIAVDLDGVERARLADQPLGQRAAAGTDLDQRLVGLRRDLAHDAVEHAAVVQEMLAEPLAREDQCASPRRELHGELRGGDEAAGIGAAGAGEVERRAVVHGGAHDGQARASRSPRGRSPRA